MNDTQAPAARPDLPVKAKVGFGKLRPVVTLHPVRPEVAEDFWRHFDLAPAAASAPFAYTLLPASGVSVTSLDLTDGEFADDELLQVGEIFVCVVADKSGAGESEFWPYQDRAKAEAAHDLSCNAHMY